MTPWCILKFIRTNWIRITFLGLLCLSGDVMAHGFAQRYDLPVPLYFYLTGAAATVVVSFIVIALFMQRGMTLYDYPRWPLSRLFIFRWLQHPYLIRLWRTLSVLLLFLIVVAGWWGVQEPFKNIAPTLVWVIWWVGFAYVSGFVGNIWLLLNPWNNSFLFGQWLIRQCLGLDVPSFNRSLPAWVGLWPAFLLFASFSWIELVWADSDIPASIATIVLVYSLLTWTGMAIFGRDCWLQRGEAFHCVFELLSRFSPVMKDKQSGQWYLQPYGLGLLVTKPVSISLVAFVVLMLSAVTFDGFMATPLWVSIVKWVIYSDSVRPIIVALQPLVGDAMAVISTLGFLIFFLLFMGLLFVFCFLMRLSVGWSNSPAVIDLAGYFVMTLIPIALAYHLAHYLSFLLIVGQYIIPLLSDPFGGGWDLFGTKHYFVDIGVVNARFIWGASVIAIVLGHIVAVFLSHVMAQRLFSQQRQVLMSQIPMLVLMVGYTLVSLWILAQPIVE